jgi:hypothetical protein
MKILFERLAQTFRWSAWVGIIYISFAIALFFDERYQAHKIFGLDKRIIVWIPFCMGYVLLMLPFVKSLTEMINKLVNAEIDDRETRRLARSISIATVIGITTIFLLLCANYYGQIKAANRAVMEKEWDRDKDEKRAPATIPYQVGWPNYFWPAPPAVSSFEPPPAAQPALRSENPVTKKSEYRPANWIEKTGGFLGPFGDFFGGVLNPILTFGTLIALAITVLMQRVQLKEARLEAKRSRGHEQKLGFETTFFNMLNLHAENARHLSFDPSVIASGDPKRLTLWRRMIYLAVGSEKTPPPVHGRAVFAEVLRSTARGATESEPQIEIYRMLQVEHNDVLGHYFRHLFQILDHIDRFKIDGYQVPFADRKRYANILRAQLSSHELSVLLLNCVGSMVDKGSFRNKIIRYRLLEHLPLYVSDDGELRAPGIEPGSEEIFFEYFDVAATSPLSWAPGAFGKNIYVTEYLKGQISASWPKPRPTVQSDEGQSA